MLVLTSLSGKSRLSVVRWVILVSLKLVRLCRGLKLKMGLFLAVIISLSVLVVPVILISLNWKESAMQLFTKPTANPKIAKSIGKYLPIILHLAPASLSGHNVCASSSAGCRAACLNTSGHGRYPRTQLARIKRTQWFFADRKSFMDTIYKDIAAHLRKCERENYLPCIRLNGTSDIVWETVWPDIFNKFSGVQFYDYTKHAKRFRKDWAMPKNYHLTFSRSESNDNKCKEVLSNGGNIAVVFKQLPKRYMGYTVQSGDETDLRFLDTKRVIGLIPKGRAKRDFTGFVVG